MTKLGRVVVLGAVCEVGAWVLGTALRPGSWRYNISDLYSLGAPHPALVMAGEGAFGIALAALVVGLRRTLPPSDHRLIACVLLAFASAGTMAGALARNACEESVPRCEGHTFATTGDWVHGIGGLVEILGIAGAALVLAAVLRRDWAIYSVATAGAVLLALPLWGAVAYPWVGTTERVLAVLLVGWVAAVGSRLSTDGLQPGFPARTAEQAELASSSVRRT